MAIRNQVTALVLLTSAALVACTAGAVGDGSPSPTASGNTEEPSVAPAPPASPKRGRVHLPIDAGRATTSAFVAKLLQADGGTDGGTDAGSPPDHAYGASISFSFPGHTATAGSWVGIAPATTPAAANWVYGWYAYPSAGATNFTFANDQLPPGTYVARLFNDSGAMYTKTAETASFTIGPMDPAPGTANVAIANGANGQNTSFGGFETIDVSFVGQPSTAYSVGVFPTYGSNALPYAMVNVTTNSDGLGTAALTELLSDIEYYEVRILQNGAWKFTSATKFRVNPALVVRQENGSVLVDYAGVQGASFDDKIQLFNTTTEQNCGAAQTLDWYWKGTATFTACGAGNYEARLYDGVGNTETVQVANAFVVQ